VRIRQEFEIELPWHRFTGSWQPDPGADFEDFVSIDGPGWQDIEEAIEWGRRRAPIVYVRFGHGRRDLYDAGEEDGYEEDDGARRWPGAPHEREHDCHPDYRGAVFLGEEFPVYWPTSKYSAALVDSESGDRASATFSDLETAIDWGRERASIVLVAEAPDSWSGDAAPAYRLWSAGSEDPPDEVLPRLRPRAGEGLTWEVATQRAAQSQPVDEYVRRMSAELESDPDVIGATCTRRARRPTISSGLAQVDVRGALGDDERQALEVARREPADDAWVDIAVRVAAPTRNDAQAIGLRAIRRAHTSAGEHVAGHGGSNEIRQID
jgi:hypothetical protein